MRGYRIDKSVKATAFTDLCHPTFCDLWYGFCRRTAHIRWQPTDQMIFLLGDGQPFPLPKGKHYAGRVSEGGAAVCAEDSASLAQGVLELMRRIGLQDGAPYLPVGDFTDDRAVGVRMAHFCVFPETTVESLRRSIRMSAVLHYTHIILEFWGTFPFDCLPELFWRDACLTKEQIKSLIDDIRLLGMEPVPMFNHLGHASQSRIASGKHVVLDQKPSLGELFSDDGWTWKISSPTVRELLSQCRKELYALFGEGEYIHLGFDEAYLYGKDIHFTDELCEFIKELLSEVPDVEHRRPILWGDMLLCHQTLGTVKGEYDCNCGSPDIEKKLLSAVDRRTVIADWQYNRKVAPVITTPHFQRLGFDTIVCPWDNCDNVYACVKTARDGKALGVMETTWHTLSKGYGALLACSENCKEGDIAPLCSTFSRPAAAALLRCITTEYEGYPQSGWISKQIEV